jgi:hypothetical protein
MGASRPPRKLLELWWQKGSRDPEKKGAARKFSPLARPRPQELSTAGTCDFRLERVITREAGASSPRRDSDFDSVRDDPGFLALLDR